jgi:Fe2+ transport system protein FeoA
MKPGKAEKTLSLDAAPQGRPLRIVAIRGGDSVRRRLLALGFHHDDLVEVNTRGVLRGPLLVKNLTSDTSLALGRGVAQKIFVEIMPDER